MLFIITTGKILFINILITEIALRNKTAIGQTFRIPGMFILKFSILEKGMSEVVFVQ